MATGPLRDSSRAPAILVQHSMLRASAWFFATFLPDYSDQSPVLISASLTLGVMCGNLLFIWVSCQPV